MIADRLENWNRYPFGDAWKTAFEFLLGLGADAEVNKHLLQGETLFAGIDVYETRPLETAVLEAHRKYVDVQVLLSGEEYIDWFPLKGLTVETPYDPEKDVGFFHRPGDAPVRTKLTPGLFVALFPDDAHSPQLMVAGPEPVKKTVVKIDVNLFQK